MSSLSFLPSVTSLLPIPLIVGVQIYRYMRVYDAVQRQQTKWFVFGFGVGFSFLAIYQVLGAVVPGLSAPDSWYQLLNALTWLSIWTLLVLSVSVAIFRYRLWDSLPTFLYGCDSAIGQKLPLSLQKIIPLMKSKLINKIPRILRALCTLFSINSINIYKKWTSTRTRNVGTPLAGVLLYYLAAILMENDVL